MNKLYVFAIGGSGSRVLRSLTMLLSSGVKIDYEIVPMILDPDSDGGDVIKCSNLMKTYQKIHSKLNFNDGVKNKFFQTSLHSLTDNQEFLLPLKDITGKSFKEFMKLGDMLKADEALIRMLFSNANLASDMVKGFRGYPHIGSIVLNQFEELNEFKTFAKNFSKGDRVFIISSIFGGTGASGFPLLLKLLRTTNNSNLLSACIGSVTILPYFTVEQNEKSAINSDSFMTKTKAALRYYERSVSGNKTLDHMYYVADDLSATPYKNFDGGPNQKDKPHIVELIAALSLIDFAHMNFTEQHNTIFHEYALHDDPEQGVIFANLNEKTNYLIRRPLTMFTIMNVYLNQRDYFHRKNQAWAKDYKGALGESFWMSEDYNLFEEFRKSFIKWLEGLSENSLSFQPFKLGKVVDALDIAVNISPSYGLFDKLRGKKSYDLIDEKLCSNIIKMPQNLTSIQVFLELFSKTLEDICEDKLKI